MTVKLKKQSNGKKKLKKRIVDSLMWIHNQLLAFCYASRKRFIKKTTNENRFYLVYKNKI